MTRRRCIFTVAAAAAVFAALFGCDLALAQEPARATRRVALVVGANDGGADRVRLRFAHADARAFARVLTQLGGVRAADLQLVLGPDRRRLLSALELTAARLTRARAAGRRLEVLLYYSGHSDERGLLLAGKRLTYARIRAAVKGLAADVRIVVLDSCASGALSMTKGGRRRPPVLHPRAGAGKGQAFLTSASAHEGAQESMRLRGSFFTHALISGLRGAADVDRDLQVTLAEAYQYAYHETLRRTESSRAGAQHPQYDFQLSGAGELVLTDLRRVTAVLVLDAALRGRVYIRDARGRLVAELTKRPGRAQPVGLAAGPHEVLVTRGSAAFRGAVTLARDGRVVLSRAHLTEATDREATVLRGSGPAQDAGAADATSLPSGSFPWAMEASGFQFGLINFAARQATGLQVAATGNMAWSMLTGVQVAPLFNYARRASGLQIGLVNVAEQDEGVAQIGLVNYVGDGLLEPTIWTSGTSYLNLGVKMGGQHLHGVLGVGVQPDWDVVARRRDLHFSVIAGLGGRVDLPSERFYLDLDLVTHLLLGGDRLGAEPGNVTKLRAMLGFRPWPRLSLYAGPTLDLLSARGLDRVGEATLTLWRSTPGFDAAATPGAWNHRLGLSFVIGVQIEPRIGRLNAR